MANYPENVPVHRLDSEHYRQMLVKDEERRFNEKHTEFLRFQNLFLEDQHHRIRELESLRKEIYSDHKHRTQESHQEFRRYQDKYREETRRY